ncbi:MAG TPA: NAD(P)/FAD-dependent oxidoreductase [Gemmatimonadales bacterium]|nr:NAD(P)/FAD-dependent oxidoreductase [Gemmatimonadales bacterium]
MPSSVGIVGGGMLGMTLARRLRAQGARVTIIEGASRAGGLVTPCSFGGFTWDRFYHVILRTDSHLIGLLEELGLEDRLRWAPTRTGFYIDGRLHSLSSSLDFALFPALSPIDKLRLAATVIRAARVRDWRPLEAIRAVDWLRRWSGRRTVERIWLPLLRAKLGANAEQASAAFIWAIIARLYGARRSSMKRESFGYVEGGYDTILARLEAELETAGIVRRYGARVAQVTGDDEGVTLSLQGGGSLRFDAVVLTVPCGQISALCPQLTDAERARLKGVTYQGIVCTSLLLKRPLADYYVTNITDAWVPFTAVVEMTTLVDRSTFGGNSLVYLPRYVTQNDPLWQQDDASVQRAFVAALERMYPHFRADDVLAWQVSRVREMLAVSTVGYSRLLAPPVTTSIPKVFVVNSAQIVNGTLNVNETLGLAEEKLPELRRRLRARAPARQIPVGAL